jgi:hypothetical protein
MTDSSMLGDGIKKIEAGAPIIKPGRIASLEAQVTQLRVELDEVRWYFAELMFKFKVAAIRQALASPEVREQLEQLRSLLGAELPEQQLEQLLGAQFGDLTV